MAKRIDPADATVVKRFVSRALDNVIGNGVPVTVIDAPREETASPTTMSAKRGRSS